MLVIRNKSVTNKTLGCARIRSLENTKTIQYPNMKRYEKYLQLLFFFLFRGYVNPHWSRSNNGGGSMPHTFSTNMAVHIFYKMVLAFFLRTYETRHHVLIQNTCLHLPDFCTKCIGKKWFIRGLRLCHPCFVGNSKGDQNDIPDKHISWILLQASILGGKEPLPL